MIRLFSAALVAILSMSLILGASLVFAQTGEDTRDADVPTEEDSDNQPPP